ncbi:MAG: hypothetical protein RQ966_19435, partial [Acetobacteraceae bacterium]|nr:hypothetical protein [Acetobacteraceae bacterium]
MNGRQPGRLRTADHRLPHRIRRQPGVGIEARRPKAAQRTLSRGQHNYMRPAWTQVAGAEGDHVARAWFVGGNPVLGETTPLSAIRTDRSEQVMLAVKVLLEDTPD